VVWETRQRRACGGKRLAALIAHLALCLAFCAQAAFAQAGNTNHQKIHPIDSEVYQAIKSLYLSRGLALPSTTGPWSEDELLRMLDRLDPAALSAGELTAYDYAERELKAAAPVFDFNFAVTAEARAHSSPEEFNALQDLIRPVDRTRPFFSMGLEARVTDYFYGFSDITVGNHIYTEKAGSDTLAGSHFAADSAFSTNIPMLPPAAGLSDIDFNVPYRAFISGGGAGWNIAVGRDRLSWGPGESGNFMVGDHVHYHNNARIAAYTKNFKYTFSVSSFQFPGNYFLDDNDDPSRDPYSDGVHWTEVGNQAAQTVGVNLFLAHRVEWRAWKDKLNFALTEGLIWQSPYNDVDPVLFNPVFIMHDIYHRDNANSLLTFEADWTVIPGLNIYAQAAVDEFRLPGEDEPEADNDAPPDGYGFMLGAKTAFPLGGGMFSASLEGALTTPYLYLRNGTVTNGENAGINWVVANRYHNGSGDAYFPEEFLGYRWGGDAIVLNANAGYRVFGQWNAKANLMLMFHGTYDRWTQYKEVYAADAPAENTPHDTYLPTTAHETGNLADPGAGERDARSVTTVLSLMGEWNLPWVRGLSVYGQGDFVFVANKGNIKGVNAFDAQFTAGLSYTF
jgi:hypothetical protein